MAKGIALSRYTEDLFSVSEEHNSCPVNSFDPYSIYNEGVREYFQEEYGTDDFHEIIHNLPSKALMCLGTENAAKALVSRKYSMSTEVEREICLDPIIDLVRKIKSSVWRYNYRDIAWNDIVDVYNGIRSFDLGIKDFDVEITYTTGYNAYGNNCRSHGGNRVWLDGVFGFLIRYKRKHVLTIGFSVAEGRRILLQQVQAYSKTGNRWMYKMPANRLEFIIEKFVNAFKGFEILLADAEDYLNESMKQYKDAHKIVSEKDQEDEDIIERLNDLSQKISNLKRDTPRIIAFYRETGAYSLGDKVEISGKRHYPIIV